MIPALSASSAGDRNPRTRSPAPPRPARSDRRPLARPDDEARHDPDRGKGIVGPGIASAALRRQCRSATPPPSSDDSRPVSSAARRWMTPIAPGLASPPRVAASACGYLDISGSRPMNGLRSPASRRFDRLSLVSFSWAPRLRRDVICLVNEHRTAQGRICSVDEHMGRLACCGRS